MYLPLRPGILGTAPRIQPAFITDTDTRRIVPLGMRPDLLHRTGRHNPPVLPDIEVVSRPVESPPAMADIQIELRKTPVFSRCRAMNHNQIDFPHTSPFIFRHSSHWETSGMQSPIPRFFVTSSSLFCYIKLFYVYTTEDTEQHRVFIFKLI